MRRFRRLVLAFSCTVVLLAGSASAEPVTISSGYLTVTGVQDVMSRGFLRAIFYDFVVDQYRLSWGDGDFTVQTVLAPRLPSPTNFGPIDGTSAVMGLTSAPFLVDATPVDGGSSPFSLSSQLRVFDLTTGAVLFESLITGAGTATWQFVTTPTGGRLLSGATYTFSDTDPVPEPATMLLFGTGLAGVLAARRRRR